ACYFLSVLARSLRRVRGLVRGPGLVRAGSDDLLASFANYAAMANVPLALWLGFVTLSVFGSSLPAVRQILGAPLVVIPTLICAGSVAVEVSASLHGVIERHIRETDRRGIFAIAITLSAIATAVTIVFAAIRLNVGD